MKERKQTSIGINQETYTILVAYQQELAKSLGFVPTLGQTIAYAISKEKNRNERPD